MSFPLSPTAYPDTPSAPSPRGQSARAAGGKYPVRLRPTFVRRPRNRAEALAAPARVVLLTEADLKRARIEMLRDLTGHDAAAHHESASPNAGGRPALPPFDALLAASLVLPA